MPRRKPYSSLTKVDQYRPEHVDGQTLYRVFQCLNPDCQEMITIKNSEFEDDYSFVCPKCNYEHFSGGEQHLFDYQMLVKDDNGVYKTVGDGEFLVKHDEYIENSPIFKYCLLCYTLKPISAFHKHRTLASGYQGECIDCKTKYNAIKNGTRTPDQFFESSQKRRLLIDVAGSTRISRKKIEDKYNHKCFNCGKDLSTSSRKDKHIDHTLPVYYLWPAKTDTATLLCQECNGNKTGKWPSAFYSDAKLRNLSVYTGLDYDLLKGNAVYNPKALEMLQDQQSVDNLLTKHVSHMDEVCKLRNRILKDTGIDFFLFSSSISKEWIDYADSIK